MYRKSSYLASMFIIVFLCLPAMLWAQLQLKASTGQPVMHVTPDGVVGIGTTTPDATARLHTAGKSRSNTVQISGNNPAEGKVLVATDAAGNATWQDALYRYSAKAVQTVAQSFSGQPQFNLYKVDLDAAGTSRSWNKGNLYDAVNKCFFLPASGIYLLIATVSCQHLETDNFITAFVTKNTEVSELTNLSNVVAQSGNSNSNGYSSHVPVQVSAAFVGQEGEYVAICVNSNDLDFDTVIRAESDVTNASIFYLGPL